MWTIPMSGVVEKYNRKESRPLRMTVHRLSIRQQAVKSVQTIQRTLQDSPVFIGLIVVTFILFLAVLVFNVLAANPTISGGLFLHGISNVSKEFPLNITPAGWAFSIWGIIYALQLVWNIYALGLLCRSTSQGPAYLNPIVLSPAYFIFFNLSSAFNIGWLFLWDRLLFLASFVFLACIALSLVLTLAIASSRLVMYKSTLIEQGRNGDVTLLQVAVINGIAMYTTWIIVASLINLGVVMVYKWSQPITNENASVICLGILSFFVIIYVTLDVTILEIYMRYSLTPYAVVIWALAASITNNYNKDNVSSLMSAVLVGAVSLAFVAKLGITFYNYSNVKNQYKVMKMEKPVNYPL